MSQQIVHAGTVVRRTYCLIEDGSIARQIPIETQCTKPTTEELLLAHEKIEEKWAEIVAEIEAEAAHTKEHEHIRNGKQQTKKREAEEPAPAG